MVLQYVAASFLLPSVSTANNNTVQYPKPHKQYEIPTIPAVVISKVLLPQSNIMAAFVHSHSSLICDVFPGLPTYRNHNVHKINTIIVAEEAETVVVIVVFVVAVVVVVAFVVAIVVVVLVVLVLVVLVAVMFFVVVITLHKF